MSEPSFARNLYAANGNRAVAALLDMVVLVVLLRLSSAAPLPGQYLIGPIAFLYLVGMPMTPLQGTLGKWVCRIRICDRLGGRLTWRAATLRAGGTVGWFALPALLGIADPPFDSALGRKLVDTWWLLFLVPWISIGFRARRESLFDLLAGSVVVTARAQRESIAQASHLPASGSGRRLLGGLGLLVFCLGFGAVFQSAVNIHQVRNLHSRVAYAVSETVPLRGRIEELNATTHRWPTAVELGLPERIPYPDGGSYRVEDAGRIVIEFSVLPELKGRRLVFTPSLEQKDGSILWQCQADAALEKRWLPVTCR